MLLKQSVFKFRLTKYKLDLQLELKLDRLRIVFCTICFRKKIIFV